MSITKIQIEALDSFQLKGLLLKKASESITNHLPCVLNGLLAFATTENSIMVYKLDRSSSQLAAKPWLVAS